MSLFDTVKNNLTIDEQNTLGDAAIQKAITSAMYRFSLLHPRVGVAVCPVTIPQQEVILPLEWEQGLSSVDQISFPVITTEGVTTPSNPTISFSWNETPKLLFIARANKGILSITIYIEEIFNSNTVISIGTLDSPEYLISSQNRDVIPNMKSEFKCVLNYSYPTDTPIYLFISNASMGSGTILYNLEN